MPLSQTASFPNIRQRLVSPPINPLDGEKADPWRDPSRVRQWRCGQIVTAGGRLESVRRRWVPRRVSVAGVWWRSKVTRPYGDRCWLDYHQPWGMPAFLVVDFIRTGAGARYRTFLAAANALDEIARLKGTLAIVAHVSNATISDRLLVRLGWERHLPQWPGRHWIKRFYETEPATNLLRGAWPGR